MSVAIRLARRGKKKQPHYFIVAQEQEKSPKGGFIEKLGYYVPQTNPITLELDLERTKEWVANGAQPSERVQKLIAIAEAGGPQAKPEKKKKFAGKFAEEPKAEEAPAADTEESTEEASDGADSKSE